MQIIGISLTLWSAIFVHPYFFRMYIGCGTLVGFVYQIVAKKINKHVFICIYVKQIAAVFVEFLLVLFEGNERCFGRLVI